jgi:flavin-dependent dehydrogenase
MMLPIMVVVLLLHRSLPRVELRCCTRLYMTKVCVYGGGLAGLSLSYHLLQLPTQWDLTIVDTHPVGTGGASAIAGGYVHFDFICCKVHDATIYLLLLSFSMTTVLYHQDR